MKIWRYFLSAGFCLLGVLDVMLLTAQAGLVSTCDEAGLRTAIAGGGTVTFACDGTIALTNTITITNNITLDGTGHDVTISGSDAVRIFNINSGISLTLLKLTLANGCAQGTNGNAGIIGGTGEGGAVFLSNGSFYASNCVFLNNKATGGTVVALREGEVAPRKAVSAEGAQFIVKADRLNLRIAYSR